VQWAATLASLPILLLVFQQFSLVSPLANALAIPVDSYIVTPLALLAALLPWWPLLALAHAVMAGLMVFIEYCASWPVWQAPAPPLWAALAAGAGVLLCLLPRGMAGRGLGVFCLLPALFWPVARLPPGTAQVTVLDVGQGLASVVQTAGHVLIYDPGPLYSAESDAGQRVVVPYLRSLGINRVDTLIVTHKDSDHSGGAASVLAAMPVAEVLSSMQGIAAKPCQAGQRWQWDGVEFEILHPAITASVASGEAKVKSNHLSCVLRVTAGGRRLLLTSDIEATDEAAMLQRYPGQLAADVLLVPHHGSRTSSTSAFLVAVGAADALIPVGYRNQFGHPKAEVLARYTAMGARLWRTDTQGALTVLLAEKGVNITAWRAEHARYWHGR
jgi:competence protein ComEC